MVLLQQMGILFVYMMIGYVACKKEYFDQEFGKKLSWLVVNVANPMLAISAVVNNEEQIAKKDFYVTVLLAICFYAFFLILAQILPRLIGVQKSDIGVYKMMTTFNNIGLSGDCCSIWKWSTDLCSSVFYHVQYSLLYMGNPDALWGW